MPNVAKFSLGVDPNVVQNAFGLRGGPLKVAIEAGVYYSQKTPIRPDAIRTGNGPRERNSRF